MYKKSKIALYLVFFLVLDTILPFNIAHASSYENITLGNTITASITPNDNENVYKIVVPKAGRIKINMLSQLEDINVYLEDTNENEIIYDYITNGSTQSPKTWEESIDLEAGTYYFKVNNFSSTGIYNLTINFSPSNNNDIEPNNSSSTAQTLTLNENPITGYISWNDDIDIYKIIVPNAGKMTLNMTSEIEQVDIYLEDSNKKIIANEYLYDATEDFPKTWNPSFDLEAGTYYIRIEKFYDTTGKYSLSTNFSPANNNDIEPNNSTNNAQTLKLNQNPITGYLSWNDDSDIYKFILPKAGKIDVKVTSEISQLYLELTDSKGKYITDDYLSDGSTKSPKKWDSSFDLEAGTYYLKFKRNYEDYTGKYTLSVNHSAANNNDIEPNNSISTSQLLTLNSAPTTGYISWNDNLDVYKISITKATNIFINMTSQVEDLYIELINSSGKKVLDDYIFDGTVKSPTTFSQDVSLSTGTYYLKVNREYLSATGKYTVKIATSSNVTFNTNGGTTVQSQSVLYNDKVIKPKNPTKSGYSFAGWYKDSSFKSTFDFNNTPITSNMTLYAKWIVPTPTSVKATSASYNSIKITWASLSGINGYEIYRSTSSNGTYKKVAETTSLSYSNTGLSTGTSYYYKVRAFKISGKTRVYR